MLKQQGLLKISYNNYHYIYYRYGCTDENTARLEYSTIAISCHSKFVIRSCGFFVSPLMPFVGASPDGVVHCDCCGRGGLEIKCPHCSKDKAPDSSIRYLEDTACGLALKKDSEYYYQVQAQIYICCLKYCDFVVWTPHGIHLERIYPCIDHFKQAMEKITMLYKYAILPELIGKCYTHEYVIVPEAESGDTEDTDVNTELWCYCNCPEGDDELMIGCDYTTCNIQWFHCSCLRMTSVPKGKWLCPDCRKIKKRTKAKKYNN